MVDHKTLEGIVYYLHKDALDGDDPPNNPLIKEYFIPRAEQTFNIHFKDLHVGNLEPSSCGIHPALDVLSSPMRHWAASQWIVHQFQSDLQWYLDTPTPLVQALEHISNHYAGWSSSRTNLTNLVIQAAEKKYLLLKQARLPNYSRAPYAPGDSTMYYTPESPSCIPSGRRTSKACCKQFSNDLSS